MSPEKRGDSTQVMHVPPPATMSSADTPPPLGKEVAEYAPPPSGSNGRADGDKQQFYGGSIAIPVDGEEIYSAREIRGLTVYLDNLWDDFIDRFPNAAFLRDRFYDQLNTRNLKEPHEAIQHAFKMFFKILFDIRRLWDPIGLPIEMTEGWRMRTDTWMMAAGMFDLRDSTPTTVELIKRKVSIIDFMSTAYFGKIWSVLAPKGIGRLSHGGDGDMVGSRLKRDASGTRQMPAMDNIFLSLLEALPVTTAIGRALRKRKICPDGPRSGYTGFSIGYGQLEKGDNRVQQYDFKDGIMADFQNDFNAFARELAPSFMEKEHQDGELWSPQVAGPLLALLERVGRYTKKTDFNILMAAKDAKLLCPVFEEEGLLGKPFGDTPSELTGLGDEVLVGVKPEKQHTTNVPRLRNVVAQWYRDHGGVPDEISSRRVNSKGELEAHEESNGVHNS